jgi:hypothetical protein
MPYPRPEVLSNDVGPLADRLRDIFRRIDSKRWRPSASISPVALSQAARTKAAELVVLQFSGIGIAAYYFDSNNPWSIRGGIDAKVDLLKKAIKDLRRYRESMPLREALLDLRAAQMDLTDAAASRGCLDQRSVRRRCLDRLVIYLAALFAHTTTLATARVLQPCPEVPDPLVPLILKASFAHFRGLPEGGSLDPWQRYKIINRDPDIRRLTADHFAALRRYLFRGDQRFPDELFAARRSVRVVERHV